MSQPQSLDTDMQRLFIQRGHRRSLPMIGEENDGGHRIKLTLHIGIKRLWSQSTKF